MDEGESWQAKVYCMARKTERKSAWEFMTLYADQYEQDF